MTDLEILAQLKISYLSIEDIIDNADETQIKTTEDLQQILKILEQKYREIYEKIKEDNDISLYYEEDLLISNHIYCDYLTKSEEYDDHYLTYSDTECGKWWEDFQFLTEF